jgi:hypothetical protein
VKLTFYVLLEALQKHALVSVGARANDQKYLAIVLGEARAKQIERFYKDAGRAGRSLSNYLNISDILKLAIREGNIELDQTIIGYMKDARNGAAHILENLVSSYADVSKLAQVKREALRILGNA